MTRVPFFAALAAGALLAGCANTIPVPTTLATPGMPNPETALRQSMQQLTPMAARNSAPVVPDDLQRIVSFRWNGSLDKGVAKLTQGIGYTFYVTAPPDAQPLNVTLQMTMVPIYRVFPALGEEAGTRATVEVDPLHHRVQVIHHV